jgi:hypothetical protein
VPLVTVLTVIEVFFVSSQVHKTLQVKLSCGCRGEPELLAPHVCGNVWANSEVFSFSLATLFTMTKARSCHLLHASSFANKISSQGRRVTLVDPKSRSAPCRVPDDSSHDVESLFVPAWVLIRRYPGLILAGRGFNSFQDSVGFFGFWNRNDFTHAAHKGHAQAKKERSE